MFPTKPVKKSFLAHHLNNKLEISSETMTYLHIDIWPWGYKTIFILNLTEHESSTALKN